MGGMLVLLTLVVIRGGMGWESALGFEFLQSESCVREVRSWWIGLIFWVCDTTVVMGGHVYIGRW